MAEPGITVRLFAAAAQAAGTEEIHMRLPEGAPTVGSVVDMLPTVIGTPQESGTEPACGLSSAASSAVPLERVCSRSSYLLNERRAQRDALVSQGDVLDVLPPFAGG